ncbi:THO complex subunit 2 [Mortierella sp. GBA30]|nr:THO complex subunit 2 [Mortierella sp. GBA30]
MIYCLENVATHFEPFIELLHGTVSNSSACAQVLGSKFQIFQQPGNRNKAPSDLYTVAALLTKRNIVQIKDVYPYLSLPDADMAKEYDTFTKSMKEKARSFKSNALAMAGALVDDTVVGCTLAADTEDKAVTDAKGVEIVPDLPLPNQKVGVVKALLAIGDLENAMFILARFPNLTASHPEIADLLCRLIHVMIEDVYTPFSPTVRHPVPSKEREVEAAHVLSPNLPQDTSTQWSEYFYPGWKDDLVRCETVQDMIEHVIPLLAIVSVRIHRDTNLVTKLCRIGAGTMSRLREDIEQLERKANVSGSIIERSGQDNTQTSILKSELQAVEKAWLEMTRTLFLPTVSLIHSNPGAINEVWQVLKGLRYETRFSLYEDWKIHAQKRYPELQVAIAATEKEAKSVMRRINNEDMKQYGRIFAKYAHSNPLVVFAAAMRQLEGGYDNMVQPLIDACKYLTEFGHDVLGYALVESLSKTVRSKIQEDGTSAAKWMNTLASFCGQLYREYNSAEFCGILQYIVRKLELKDAQDLVVLRELLSKMGGIEDTSNLNASQLLAMAGGELLKNETLYGGITGMVMKKDPKSCLRLHDTVLRDNIASQLLVLLAQQRQHQSIQGNPEIPHIKVLSTLFDQAHTTLLQFMEFLAKNLFKEYSDLVPSLTDLCVKYRIEPNIAMSISRPKLQDLTRKEQHTLPTSKVKAKDKTSTDTGQTRENSGTMVVDGQGKAMGESTAENQVWLPSLESITQEVVGILPPHTWRGLRPQFYVTFWQLTLSDIFVPVDQYKAEIAKMQRAVKVIENDQSKQSSKELKDRKEDRERLLKTILKLDMEMKQQLSNHKRVMDRLQVERQHWFQGLASERQDVISQVIQHCIYPRAILSNLDALFCAKFIQILHSIGTSDLSTLTLYDKILVEADRILLLSTESEAKSYGQFLCELLTNLGRWHTSRTLYEKEGRGTDLPGFQKKWGTRNSSYKINQEDLLDFEDFRRVLYRCHVSLFKGGSKALESGEYMQIKNTILMLRETASCYPTMTAIGDKLFDIVRGIATTEKREDLKLLANAYLGVLKKHKDSACWMLVTEFHIPRTATAGPTKRATTSVPGPSGPNAAQARVETSRVPLKEITSRDHWDTNRDSTRKANLAYGRDYRREDGDMKDSRESNSQKRSRDTADESGYDARDVSRKKLRDWAPRDPRDRDARNRVRINGRYGRDNRDSRTGGASGRKPRDNMVSTILSAPEDTKNVGHVARRNASNHGDSMLASANKPSYDRERDHQHVKGRYREEDRRHYGRDASDDKVVDRSGGREKRYQGRDKLCDNNRYLSCRTLLTTPGRDHQRAEIGSRDADRCSFDRRDSHQSREDSFEGRSRVYPTKREDDRGKDGRDRESKETPPASETFRLGGSDAHWSSCNRLAHGSEKSQLMAGGCDGGWVAPSRTGTLFVTPRQEPLDRERKSPRRQDAATESEGKPSLRESQRNERRIDSGNRKRGPESRDTSVDRDKNSKRRRDGAGVNSRQANASQGPHQRSRIRRN